MMISLIKVTKPHRLNTLLLGFNYDETYYVLNSSRFRRKFKITPLAKQFIEKC